MNRLMRVTGPSMEPTLRSGELVLISARAYRVRKPRVGELVAARPAAAWGRAVIKRLAGLPHQRVEVDGQQWMLGEDEFFLLGDHLRHSEDSRTFGPVTRGELIGPVQFRVWPWRVFAGPSTPPRQSRPPRLL